jgi:hypothetical protein
MTPCVFLRPEVTSCCCPSGEVAPGFSVLAWGEPGYTTKGALEASSCGEPRGGRGRTNAHLVE